MLAWSAFMCVVIRGWMAVVGLDVVEGGLGDEAIVVDGGYEAQGVWMLVCSVG